MLATVKMGGAGTSLTAARVLQLIIQSAWPARAERQSFLPRLGRGIRLRRARMIWTDRA